MAKKLSGLDAFLASRKSNVPADQQALVAQIERFQDADTGKMACRIRVQFAGAVNGALVFSFEQFERKDCWQAALVNFFSDALSTEKKVEVVEGQGCEWLPEQVKKPTAE